jgi:hypothetical protein
VAARLPRSLLSVWGSPRRVVLMVMVVTTIGLSKRCTPYGRTPYDFLFLPARRILVLSLSCLSLPRWSCVTCVREYDLALLTPSHFWLPSFSCSFPSPEYVVDDMQGSRSSKLPLVRYLPFAVTEGAAGCPSADTRSISVSYIHAGL